MKDLTPSQRENIEKAARVAQTAQLLAQCAFENGLDIDQVLPMVIGLANEKLTALKQG